MTHLAEKMCRVVKDPDEGIAGNDLQHYRAQVHGDWEIEEDSLRRSFLFSDYGEALEFTQSIAKLSDAEGHHPEIRLRYGEVEVVLDTQEVEGLHENDFIMAAKIDRSHSQSN
jgi:4a-hydroxytetrahydrobiopterin dehydratase